MFYPCQADTVIVGDTVHGWGIVTDMSVLHNGLYRIGFKDGGITLADNSTVYVKL